jgi:thiol-disulfide isomerase/thioredoxin
MTIPHKFSRIIQKKATHGARMKKHVLSLIACISCLFHAALAANPSGPAIGTLAPDFKARNLLTGETISLSSQRGKITILTFWASWCGPCRRELPILEGAQQLVGKDKLTVFAVSYKESRGAQPGLKKFAASLHINLIEDNDGSIADRYAISTIPHLFLIDRQGKVIANHLGYGNSSLDQLVADLNQAFAGSTPAEPSATPAPAPADSAP